MNFPVFDFNFSNFNVENAVLQDSQGSMLSPRSQFLHDSSGSGGGSILGLVIPTSDRASGAYQHSYNDPFQISVSSVLKLPGTGRLYEDEPGILDDFDFEFDADGKMIDIDIAEREARRSASLAPNIGRLESDSAASRRVRQDHIDAFAGRASRPEFDIDGDLIMQIDDHEVILPAAEPFPSRATPQAQRESEDHSRTKTDTLSSVVTPVKKRRPRTQRTINADEQLEVSNSDIRHWQNDYLENMDSVRNQKRANRAPALARSNAYTWVFGVGIGGIGGIARGIQASHLPDIFAIYSGNKLRESITGIATANSPARSAKHPRNEDDEENEGRRVRARQDQNEDQIGRGNDDDLMPMLDNSIGAEMGRDAQPALDDHLPSAMPWNISASLHSYRALPLGSSSIIRDARHIPGRPSSILSATRPGSRLTSASPLLGRNTTALLDDFDSYMAGAGGSGLGIYADEGAFPTLRDRDTHTLTTTQDAADAAEFELFGPMAAIDTQTAQTSQVVKEALARESLNFLDFVKNTLAEEAMDELKDAGIFDDAGILGREGSLPGPGGKEVAFETLFPPESNSRMVAAQAFHHVLTLATRNLLRVSQQDGFSDIMLGIRDTA